MQAPINACRLCNTRSIFRLTVVRFSDLHEVLFGDGQQPPHHDVMSHCTINICTWLHTPILHLYCEIPEDNNQHLTQVEKCCAVTVQAKPTNSIKASSGRPIPTYSQLVPRCLRLLQFYPSARAAGRCR